MKKKALITGITGQDGSYLAEFLLSKGYQVHGLVRRVALEDPEHRLWRIKHILDKVILHPGSMESYASIFKVVEKIRPNECYHLAAQSFVSYSFEDEFSTFNTNVNGTLYILSAIKELAPKCKFYFAASSEMFGLVKETPQNENTPFHPRSPYGISKTTGFYLTQNYRESYGIFACNGILFNHESIPKNSPIVINIERNIDVLPIEDLFKVEKHRYEGILDKYKGAFVWNGEYWTKIIGGTCYKNKKKILRLVQTREACYEATLEHVVFNEANKEIKTQDVKKGDKLFKVKFPESKNRLNLSKRLAYFLGYLVGDGHVDERGRIRLTGTNKQELVKIADLITGQFGWTYRLKSYGPGNFDNCKKDIWQLDINNDSYFGLWLRKHIYTKHSCEKRIPAFILNSDSSIKKSFFDGYYLADGRSKGNERYKYKGFTTKSATLSLGLIFLFKSFSNQTVKCKCEYRDGKRYYYVQFGTQNPTNKGKHLKKDLNEVIEVFDTVSPDGWFFDIQTESHIFATGPNLCKIHNSPRRGFEFVTRKISYGVAKIKAGLSKELKLGNLDAKRDWGYAKDYVEAMWLMLQQDDPDDYVVATGETYSVREFVKLAFKYAGLDWKKYVKTDRTFYRPAEVHLLKGDYSKAKKRLRWHPRVSFKGLVKMMVDEDLRIFNNAKRGN